MELCGVAGECVEQTERAGKRGALSGPGVGWGGVGWGGVGWGGVGWGGVGWGGVGCNHCGLLSCPQRPGAIRGMQEAQNMLCRCAGGGVGSYSRA
jgi:hypothetical protein